MKRKQPFKRGDVAHKKQGLKGEIQFIGELFEAAWTTYHVGKHLVGSN